jgi:TRAP-type C4-dicarboxylate transport system substrate-binding protein
MKVRVPGIRMYIDVFKLFEADPSSMNFAEVFTALAQGTMDGQENPLSVIFSSRLYEVQKYLTIWDYSYDPVILCINRSIWESLPEEDRAVFAACAKEAMAYERDLVADGETAILDSLTAKGMEVTTLSPEAVASFRSMVEPVYSSMAGEIGGDTIRRFTDAVE